MIPRTRLIEKSLACCGWGGASLLPVLGLPCSLIALHRFRQVVQGTHERWNPARRPLLAGAALALLGFFLHAIIIGIVCFKWVRLYYDA